jgi:hypothetical protein
MHLFTVTEKWLKDHSKGQTEIGNRVLKKNKKNKNILFLISSVRLSDLIGSLPDAKKELEPTGTW